MQLLESKRGPRRVRGTATFSVIAHVAILALAVGATASGAIPDDPPARETAVWVAPPPPATSTAPAEARAPARTSPATNPAPAAPPVPSVPMSIPIVFPEVGTPLADPLRGVAEAIARGDRLGEATAPGAAIGSPDGVFSESTVERPVIAIPGVVPRYPERLRGQGQEGRVVVRFVVDTTGRVEGGSVQVTSAAHALFADAVRRTLPAMRFRPAEARGHRVRQLVEMPFDFVLSR